jgi:hypothetical protein
VPILTRSPGAEAELMKALYDEHAPVLWPYEFRLTGNRTSAETWCKRAITSVAASGGYRRHRALGTGPAVHRRLQHKSFTR